MQNYKMIGVSLLLSTLLVVVSFVIQGNVQFDMADEGYLWYGVQEVMRGGTPMLDFMSYDPGRYYWSASIMSLFNNNGIMDLRMSIAIFQIFGLAIGFFLILSHLKTFKKLDIIYLSLSLIILFIWMYPRHKLYDISLSIMLVANLSFFVQYPTKKGYFWAGCCIGLVAFFGRNHGLYGLAGFCGTVIWLAIKEKNRTYLLKKLLHSSVGIIVGYSPMFALMSFKPKFTTALWESILFYFEIKTTNLTLPIPFPWLVDFSAKEWGQVVREILIGCFFIALIVAGITLIIRIIYMRLNNKQVSPTLVAASFLTLPYAHYAYSRADINHLAHGIFPFLIACLILAHCRYSVVQWYRSFFLVLVLLVSSVWVLLPYHPGPQCFMIKNCVEVQISGNHLKINTWTNSAITLIRNLVSQYAPNGENFFVTPNWPGAYPMFDRRSSEWELHAVFKRSETFQQAEIKKLQEAKLAFAIVSDFPLDGREDRRYSNTHPLIYRYIEENFIHINKSSKSVHRVYIPR